MSHPLRVPFPEESYDIAYAHARESSQTNLLEVVEKEMIGVASKKAEETK